MTHTCDKSHKNHKQSTQKKCLAHIFVKHLFRYRFRQVDDIKNNQHY